MTASLKTDRDKHGVRHYWFGDHEITEGQWLAMLHASWEKQK